MEYREIGNTGMKAGVIGLGCEHLDGKPYRTVKSTIDAALYHGVNMVDIFMPGEEVRRNIGRALGARRGEVMLQGHIGSVDLNQQYDISRDLPTCKRYFENLLRDVGTDYIDFGMLFFLDSQDAFDAVFKTDIVTYAQDLKKKGVIRGIGASSHNPLIAARVVETGVLDVLLFSINPAFDMVPGDENALEKLDDNFKNTALGGIDPARARLYRLCEQHGVGITVMKTMGAGRLLSAKHSPFARALTPGQCIHYALSRPAVVSCLAGCATKAQVEKTMAYFELSDAERDYTGVISAYAAGGAPACMYCNHCQPCPCGIDIAAATKYLDIAALDEKNVPPSVASHYRALGHHGGECVRCGQCEARCPFGVHIMDNMERAGHLFGL